MTKQQAIDKLVAWCNGEVGYHEGENNWNKYANDDRLAKLYGWRAQEQPWCDLWTDEAFIVNFGLEAASAMTYQPIGKGSPACRTSAQFFRDNNAFFYRPEVGDVIFFIYSGAINHQGIVTGVSGLSVTTVEGNSSDAVSRRVYTINDAKIAGYGRPKWSVVAAENDNSGKTDATSGEIPVKDEAPAQSEKHLVSGLPVLRKGDKGEVVRAAQFLLNGRGCSCGAYGADGDFGVATEAAVKAFQRRKNKEAGRQVLDVDGVIGQYTFTALLGVN